MYGSRFGARVLAVPVGVLVGLVTFVAAPAGAVPVGPSVTGTGICFGYPTAGGCAPGFGGSTSAVAGSTVVFGATFTTTSGVDSGSGIVLDGLGSGIAFPNDASDYQVNNVSTSTGCSVSTGGAYNSGQTAWLDMPSACAATPGTQVVVLIANTEVPGTAASFSLSLWAGADSSPVGTNTLSAISVPSAPEGLGVTRELQAIDVSWGVPDDDGGSALTGYNVYCSDTTPSTSDTPSATTDASTTSATISGLAAHTTYTCIVTAVNGVGQSQQSDPVSAAPYGVPSPPQNLSSTRGNGSVTLFWDKPTDVGGTPITGYTAYCSTSYPPAMTVPDLCGSFGPAQRSGTVRGLTNGVTYYIGLTAANTVTESELSGIAGPTPGGPPSRPWALRAKPFRGSLELRWKVPTNDGGDAVTGYDVRCATDPLSVPGAPATTATTNAIRISGLTSGTPYFCAVVAKNTVGDSHFSKAVTGTPN